MKLIEMLAIRDGYKKVVLVNPARVTVCMPEFKQESDEWSHTAVWLSGGGYLNVDMSLEQIEEAFAKAST